tara:strand:+ start:24 stop:1829 length:1806 start_codon:yes stop_codon:yes gene_type:complete
MDEFGSPLAGGIQAVRRNISSSFLGAPRQAQSDPVTTSLLQQQSLSIGTVSQQLSSISGTLGIVNANLKGIQENLSVSDTLERQREAAKQNRERILAEQGLREGKESELENKIQQSLTQPLQRIGVKTQSTLGGLTNSLLFLAGGWLTVTGIDLLQSMAEGNQDKINKLKVRFLGGLTIIAGTLTAITLGIRNTLRILGMFTANVARVAFGGLLKVGLKGVQVLLAGLVKKAAMLGGGFLAGGGIGGLIQSYLGYKLTDNIFSAITGGGKKKVARRLTTNLARTMNPSKILSGTPRNIKKITAGVNKIDDVAKPNLFSKAKRFLVGEGKNVGAMANPTTTGGVVGKAKGAINRGLNPLKNLIGNLFKKLPGKNVLAKLLSSVGVKGGLKTLFKRFGGPLATFIINLASGDGIGKALAATAGYAAAAAATAKILAPMLALPIPGARILYGILVLAGGIAGEAAIRKLYDGILGLFGFGKKKDKDKNKIKDKDKTNVEGKSGNVSVKDRTYSDEEVDMLNAGGTLDAAGNVVPINNGSKKATEISQVDDSPEIITLPMPGASGGVQEGGGAPAEKASSTLPSINFDSNNPHTLYATSVTGAGN